MRMIGDDAKGSAIRYVVLTTPYCAPTRADADARVRSAYSVGRALGVQEYGSFGNVLTSTDLADPRSKLISTQWAAAEESSLAPTVKVVTTLPAQVLTQDDDAAMIFLRSTGSNSQYGTSDKP